MAYRIKNKPLHGLRVSSLLCLSLSLRWDPRGTLAFLQLLFALHLSAYSFICWSDFIPPSRLNFPYQESLPSQLSLFLSLIGSCSLLCSTYYREMSCLLICLIHVFPVRLQALQRWGGPHPSYSLLITSPEHNA